MIEFSRELRKNSTIAEQRLWQYLRDRRFRSIKFRRQYVIKPYIVDFVCAEYKLIIEIDGSQHLENQDYDNNRTIYFESLGYKVIRFWNNEILQNMKNVLEAINNELL